MKVLSSKTFDLLDLDELDEEFEALRFIADYEVDRDGLITVTVKSKRIVEEVESLLG